jgi:hypothetical protein
MKHGCDTRFIIDEAGLTNISHSYIVMLNGERVFTQALQRGEIF